MAAPDGRTILSSPIIAAYASRSRRSAPNTDPTPDRAQGCNECREREKRAVGHILQLDGESADPRRMHSTLELLQPLFALEGDDLIDATKVVA